VNVKFWTGGRCKGKWVGSYIWLVQGEEKGDLEGEEESVEKKDGMEKGAKNLLKWLLRGRG